VRIADIVNIAEWIAGPFIFAGLLIFLELGRRLGLRRRAKKLAIEGVGFGVLESAVFALMGLLVAFTFSGAASRYEKRWAQIAEEANSIGTAYLRLDLLPADSQPALRDLFRRYVDARLSAYRKFPDVDAVRVELAKANALQGTIWTQALAACRESPMPQIFMLVVPALNAMIDITTTRTETARLHSPTIILVMLGGLALVCSLLAGFGMASNPSRSWIHILGFAFVLTATLVVILDLEYPRFGYVRLDAGDQVLQETRDAMK